MQDRIYLLSIAEFLEESGGEELMAQVLEKVDESRRKKAERIRQRKAKAASLGAGLLLQLAVRDALQAVPEQGRDITEFNDDRELVPEEGAESTGIHNNLAWYSVREALSRVDSPTPLEFTYRESGKPYFKEDSFYFNLSHSGEYVVCAISEQEIGVDIQEHRGGSVERIAKRYFAPEEVHALENASSGERTKAFFDMWAAKEAYGKYTGGGITISLELEIPANQVALQMIHSIPGYSLAVCKAL